MTWKPHDSDRQPPIPELDSAIEHLLNFLWGDLTDEVVTPPLSPLATMRLEHRRILYPAFHKALTRLRQGG